MQQVGGVSYGAFIVPGLIMLSLLTQSISNASIGIYFPKFTGTIFEILSAPLSYVEVVARLCRRGRHQVGCDRPHHSGDRHAVCAGANPPPLLDGRASSC